MADGTEETIEEALRDIRARFQRKFVAAYPDHPWVKLWKEEETDVDTGAQHQRLAYLNQHGR